MSDSTFREYRTIDKSDWPQGEWQGEPDKRQWTDEATGLPCLIVRGPSGALCGYVGVSSAHPLHKVSYGQEVDLLPAIVADVLSADGWRADLYAEEAAAGRISPEALFNVHGGLTFSDGCSHSADPARGVCHIPAPGEPDDVWWFGFDCAHSGDYCPKYREMYPDDCYRPVAYVERECAGLAKQLVAVAEQVSA